MGVYRSTNSPGIKIVGPSESCKRVPISEATRLLLCDFATGDLDLPLHEVNADWDEVFRGICRHGLLGLAHRYITRSTTVNDDPPESFRQAVGQAYRQRSFRQLMMVRQIRVILAFLLDQGIEFLVLKGPVLAHQVYPDPFLRFYNDLDIVVREEDALVIHRALTAEGFEALDGLVELPPKIVPQAVIYERKYWSMERKLLVEVHYDDLLNAGLSSRDVDGFWERAVAIRLEGVPVRTLCLEDQLVYLCAHVHYHGYPRLNWLSDIAFIVRDHADELNWEQVERTAHREEAEVGVYYTLFFLDKLLGVRVPDEVIEAVKPDAFRRWTHERLLPEDKVVSLQPMWRPDFSFYFTPVLKRMLPDLLVMGRRVEKVRYLFRLLVPPRAWLRHYYRLEGSRGLWVHYLLHPLKLIWHLGEEVVGMVLGKLRKGAG